MIKILTFVISFILTFFTLLKRRPEGILANIFTLVISFVLFFIMIVAIFFIIAFLCSFFLNKKKKAEGYDRFYHTVYTSYCYIVMSLFGVKLKVEGMEKLPKDQRYLVVQNHVSNMDPIITNFVLRKEDLIFVSKASLFKIPFFGKMIHKMGYVKLRRDNSKEDGLEFLRGAKWLGEGKCSVALYPEGTRNKHPETIKLQEFKSSSLKMGTKSFSPIVISTIEGTENINRGLLIRTHKVTVKIVDVLYKEDYENKTLPEISDIVYQKMDENLEYHKKIKGIQKTIKKEA